MKKRNVYLSQVSFTGGKSVYYPYAAGVLAACALQDETVRENYSFEDIFFIREKPEDIVNRLVDPYYVGFSSYMWNFEYNKVLAKAIKEKYPDCIIQFGGHQISPAGKLLEQYPFIDIAMYYEGEEPFRALLLELLKDEPDLSEINNISYRKNGEIIDNPCSVPDGNDYPSPYLTGVFDKMTAEHPELEFIPLLESNRGCPNHCTYCGWGLYKSKIRLFPLERVFAELEWVCGHKSEFLGLADGNFGLFERDKLIVDKMIELKQKTGYPKKFQTSYSKNSDDVIFDMTKKLNEYGLDKGVTLSFQSMSPEVLKNIGRSNIDMSDYKRLLKKYIDAGIPTYSELIIGLPGETVESFTEAVNTLLEAGQHTSLYIHMLEWLPCTALGSRAYMKKFGIEYSVVPINQPHRGISPEGDIPEYSRLVTKTSSMSKEDWVKMNLFAVTVQSFHHLGLLQFAAIYCYHDLGVSYADFYSSLLAFAEEHPEKHFSRVISETEKKLHDVAFNNSEVCCYDPAFGEILWPAEEFIFLKLISDKELFYTEIADFIKKMIPDAELRKQLMLYQKTAVKSANNPYDKICLDYDFPGYFRDALALTPSELVRRNTKIVINDPDTCTNMADYARFIVWYGRKGGKNIYGPEAKIIYDDGGETE